MMAIVEDGVQNESEEENKIEVVVEEDDTWDEETEDEDTLEAKAQELELRISENPYNYDDHSDLLQILINLTELDRYRSAFERLKATSVVAELEWHQRLHTEASLATTAGDVANMVKLFNEASLDCFSQNILLEWCSWALTLPDDNNLRENTREQIKEVLRRAGADPLTGKLFWNAALAFENEILQSLDETDERYHEQAMRVLYSLEEMVSRPLLQAEESWFEFEQLALKMKDEDYVDKVHIQHETAQGFLEFLMGFEQRILSLTDDNEKSEVYRDYIDAVIDASRNTDKYVDCDIENILKVLYDRATYECIGADCMEEVFRAYLKLGQNRCSTNTYIRIVDSCIRRRPNMAFAWGLKLQLSEELKKPADEMKSIFESAIAQCVSSFKDSESVWMEYLSYLRRSVDVTVEANVEMLRKNFRHAWDSLAEMWHEEANDCCVPMFWARLEYKLFGDPKRGRELFEEIFSYGENKTLSKYWECLFRLESHRNPPLSRNKTRELHRRSVKYVEDYPPTLCAMWIEYERDYGSLATLQEATAVCQEKLQHWHDNYQAQCFQGQKQFNKKEKPQKKKENKKRKLEDGEREKNNKKKKVPEADDAKGTKRSHDDDKQMEEDGASKRAKSEESTSEPKTREDFTLFVSNLDFKVNEEKLREKLSEYGEIVSLRVKAGVKAFGGSICYCQYRSVESVEKALKYDRTPLDGRPMFLSKYTVKKTTKPQFKYSTGAEKNKLFVKNIPYSVCTKEELAKVFEKYGELKDVRIVTFKDGKPKGLAYVEFTNDESAKAALQADGLLLEDRHIQVALSNPPTRDSAGIEGACLGAPKRETKPGMRRTQLTSFIPRVVLRAASAQSESKDQTPSTSQGVKMSNSDFRLTLIKK